LAVLDVSDNKIGDIVLVDGITHCKATSGEMLYWDKDKKSLGEEAPPGCGPLGIIALTNAIPDMGALTYLDISNNSIGGYYTNPGYANNKFVPTPEGPKAIADILPYCQ
jgi:hypothetical protein